MQILDLQRCLGLLRQGSQATLLQFGLQNSQKSRKINNYSLGKADKFYCVKMGRTWYKTTV